MISERVAVRGFESIWRTRFPMLTPAFMTSFNQQFVKPVVRDGGPLAPSPTLPASNSPDLVAELGIQIARSAVEACITIEDVLQDQSLLQAAWIRSLELLARYEGEIPVAADVPLDAEDKLDAFGLSRTLFAFLSQTDDEVQFGPLIPGAGTLSRCEGDLAVGDVLVEIKTVSRRFRSHDLRQLLVYLALDWARAEPRWTRGCLLNPRRAVWAEFDVDWLVRRLSGRAAVDAFRDLLDAFASSVEVETSLF